MTAINWLFRNRRTGQITIAQFPNLALWTFLVATVAVALLDSDGALRTALKVIATGSLLWWAGDEVVRGVNPFRNALGGVVLVVTLVGLVAQI